MATRTPRIEYYWSMQGFEPRVNVRLWGANGEQIAQITQGYRDKTDARRGVQALRNMLSNSNEGPRDFEDLIAGKFLREVGPGKKPEPSAEPVRAARQMAAVIQNLPPESFER